jgi:Flp pilus assembly protein CpaB
VRRRSNLLVLLGLASFVLGLVAVYLITGDDDDGGGAGGGRVPVLVATEDVEAGTLGDEIVAAGSVEVREVDLEARAPDALTSLSQLSGTRLTQLFPEGEQIRSGGIATLGGARAQIPEGFEAVALSIDFVAGGANTVIPNDRVNVFLHQTTGGTSNVDEEGNVVATQTSERVQLLLTNVLVLDVQRGTPNLAISQPSDPAQAAASASGPLVVVVAVNTVDAEKVIFGSSASGSSLYLSRVRVDDEGNPAPPAAGDPAGRSLENILAESAQEAFTRSNP